MFLVGATLTLTQQPVEYRVGVGVEYGVMWSGLCLYHLLHLSAVVSPLPLAFSGVPASIV